MSSRDSGQHKRNVEGRFSPSPRSYQGNIKINSVPPHARSESHFSSPKRRGMRGSDVISAAVGGIPTPGGMRGQNGGGDQYDLSVRRSPNSEASTCARSQGRHWRTAIQTATGGGGPAEGTGETSAKMKRKSNTFR